jgi:hypothetical protein
MNEWRKQHNAVWFCLHLGQSDVYYLEKNTLEWFKRHQLVLDILHFFFLPDSLFTKGCSYKSDTKEFIYRARGVVASSRPRVQTLTT